MKAIIPVAHQRPEAHATMRLAASALVLLCVIASGCQLEAQQQQMQVRVLADGQTAEVQVPAGSTAANALAAADIQVGPLDRTEPPAYTLLSAGDEIHLIRVEERFRTETRTIPFQRQLLRNESLPEGEERLVQDGANGQEELTYRAILEDGIQVRETVIKSVLLTEPVPEIVMIGARSSLASVSIPGIMAYLSAGNAWLISGNTGDKELLVRTGDLDGRVFALSPDARYLLFSRRSEKPIDQEINTLWVAPTDPEAGSMFSLHAANIVHFAGWYPDSPTTVGYTTVEPRANAPGWQANNDFFKVSLQGQPNKILDAQSGGIYGWWGTDFAFSSNGRLAYSRPDGIGLVSQDGGYLAPLVNVTPFQTHADWAWIPGIAWSPDNQVLYYVDHSADQPDSGATGTTQFDLKAKFLDAGNSVTLAANVGMFAAPAASRGSAGGSLPSRVAYLQAIFPDQSDVSRYRLVVMDRDGSNRQELFPAADLPGLEPQQVVWAPAGADQPDQRVCVVYQGNIWLVDAGSGEAHQITGDGLVSAVDWR